MKLHIENFAKISRADIQFDGLTVIAGDNNTGKSTVGKVLYAFFRSLSNLDHRIQNERLESIRAAFDIVPGVDFYKEDIISQLLKGVEPRQIVGDILNIFWDTGEKVGSPRPLGDSAESMVNTYSNSVMENIAKARQIRDDEYANRIILRVFDCVFHKQYHPLQQSDGISRLVLTVKNQENLIEFRPDLWKLQLSTKLIKKVRLISSPDIISFVNVPGFDTDKNAANYFEKYTYEIINELRQESSLSTSNQIESENLLKEIYQRLDAVIDGTFKRDDNNDFALFENGHTSPTKAANLSMGLKSFVLLRFMLEKGVLSEHDVLILDEPENHLHPEWQVKYAQLLVLLQKTFKLSMLVTTHSNFFVNALQRFSTSEGIQGQTHFYLSQPDLERPGFCTFSDRNSSASAIMRSFNAAYDAIDEMSDGGE